MRQIVHPWPQTPQRELVASLQHHRFLSMICKADIEEVRGNRSGPFFSQI